MPQYVDLHSFHYIFTLSLPLPLSVSPPSLHHLALHVHFYLSSFHCQLGVPQTFTVTVTPLRNLPLDLYVLIDLSGSMIEELNSLKQVAGDIGIYK